MRAVIAVFALGLLSQQALCQINPMMLAMMGGNPNALGAMGAMGAMGGAEAQDLMMLHALSQSQNQGSTGGSGGSGGSGGNSGGLFGGIDPAMLMMLTQGGGGFAAGTPNDMFTMMMLSDMMRGNNQGGGNNQGEPNTSGPQPGGPQPGQPQQPGAGGFAGNIASILGNSGSGVTPDQQNRLWQFVNFKGLTKRIMDAAQSPEKRVQLEKDGLIQQPQSLEMRAMTIEMCPRVSGCQFPICEATEIPYTPESFYMCQGCPRCRLDNSQQTMMNMMGQMGGNKRSSQISQQIQQIPQFSNQQFQFQQIPGQQVSTRAAQQIPTQQIRLQQIPGQQLQFQLIPTQQTQSQPQTANARAMDRQAFQRPVSGIMTGW